MLETKLKLDTTQLKNHFSHYHFLYQTKAQLISLTHKCRLKVG